MITAKEALQHTQNIVGEIVKQQFEDLEKRIVQAADTGSTYLYFPEHILPQVETELKRLGYDVKYNTQRNESWTTISWSEPKC